MKNFKFLVTSYLKKDILKFLLNLKHFIINNNSKLKMIKPLTNKTYHFCILRSPHVNKDSREHYYLNLFHVNLEILFLNVHTINNFLKVQIPYTLQIQNYI